MKRTCILTLIILVASATAAWAEHRRYDEMARVKTLAHQLEEAAHHVHEAAERTAHHRTREESAALRSLHQLADQARHFHRQVERYYRDPEHTVADFRSLVGAYEQTRYRIRYLHAFDHVKDDFHTMQSLMDRLIDYYGGHDSHGGYGSRHPGSWDGHHRDDERRYVPWWRY